MKLAATILIFVVLTPAWAQVNTNPNQGAGASQGTVVFARVDPTGLSTGGTGIRGVTQTNLTQTTTDVVRNFFAGGGVGFSAGGNPAAGGLVSSGVPVSLVGAPSREANVPASPMKNYRDQLVAERTRLVTLISRKRLARQSISLEISQNAAVESELLRLERELAFAKARASTPGAPPRATSRHR